MAQGILAFAEQREGTLKKHALEAVSAAAALKADVGGPVTAVVIGSGIQEIAADLAAYGADEIVAFDQDFLRYYSGAYGHALVQAVKQADPAVVIVPASIMGRDLGARVAAELDTGLASDCIEIGRVDGAATAKRPVYAGKAHTSVTVTGTPAVLGIRPNIFAAAETNPGARGDVKVTGLEFDVATIRAIVKDITSPDNAELDVSEADIIVSGGRGVGSPEGFGPLEDLAKVLGAAVGASRAVVDAGWRDHAAQVGQTGKTVSPTLYIACGISGAIQHLAGMRTSKVIVAVNKDPDAAIFKVANYGIVGDLFEVVPAMTEAFKQAL